MTGPRYESYRSVLAALDELETLELEDDEREVLRDAAEALLLTRSGKDQERDEILLDTWFVLSSLVRTGRWRYRAADQMRRMLEACGPERAPGARRRCRLHPLIARFRTRSGSPPRSGSGRTTPWATGNLQSARSPEDAGAGLSVRTAQSDDRRSDG